MPRPRLPPGTVAIDRPYCATRAFKASGLDFNSVCRCLILLEPIRLSHATPSRHRPASTNRALYLPGQPAQVASRS